VNRHGNDASKRQACGRLNRNPSLVGRRQRAFAFRTRQPNQTRDVPNKIIPPQPHLCVILSQQATSSFSAFRPTDAGNPVPSTSICPYLPSCGRPSAAPPRRRPPRQLISPFLARRMSSTREPLHRCQASSSCCRWCSWQVRLLPPLRSENIAKCQPV
jgi:hypothetical protein